MRRERQRDVANEDINLPPTRKRSRRAAAISATDAKAPSAAAETPTSAAPDEPKTQERKTPTETPPTEAQIQACILSTLSTRAAGSTCCPSEIPRRMQLRDWRAWMGLTRAVAFRLAGDGVIEITQKGQVSGGRLDRVIGWVGFS